MVLVRKQLTADNQNQFGDTGVQTPIFNKMTTTSQALPDYENPPASEPESGADSSSKTHKAESILTEIMQEAAEASQENPQAEPIPPKAYEETQAILKVILKYVPLPDLMWLEDGGIGFEWRKGSKRIFTLSVYGDGHVIFVGIFGEKNKIRGITPLLDRIPKIPETLLKTIIEHFPNES